MTCTLTIDTTILKSPLPYKYVVYSPRMTKEDDCFEHLYYYASGDRNLKRCLRIDFKRVYRGMYIHTLFLIATYFCLLSYGVRIIN